MRTKRTTSRFAFKLDKLFWFFIQIFPILAFLLFLITGSRADAATSITFNGFLVRLGLDYSSGNIFYSIFSRLFGSEGVFPLFVNSGGIILFFTYVCVVEILHLCFDVIVFIPRLAHKWISKAVQDD